jgi:YD repeat-containing protein
VSEPATVTVGGKAAAVTADNRFEGQTAVPGGTGQVAVTATDPSGNLRTNTYEVTQGATSKTFTYDPNGNLSTKTEGSDTWTYSWNAENELAKVEKNGVEQARFAYDPLGRRVEEVAGGVTTSYTYDGLDILREVRGGNDAQVRSRAIPRFATGTGGRHNHHLLPSRRPGERSETV